MMRRLLILLCLLVASPTSAQITPVWGGVTPPIFGLPASAVTGGGTVTSAQLLCSSDGTAVAPCYSFLSEPTLGMWRPGSGILGLTVPNAGSIRQYENSTAITYLDDTTFTLGAALTLTWGSSGIGSADVALSRGAANRLDLASADSFNLVGGGGSYQMAAKVVISSTAPTISSGFGTTPAIVASNGTAAFTINVGTGGTANSGVIGFPAAPTGWAVQCMNTSTNTATVFLTKQTATTTTTATIGNYDAAGAAAAWVASNVLVCSAIAF